MQKIHGGDIYRNHVTVDFSVNVNPLGIPEEVKDALYRAVGNCHEYPDIAAQKLKRAVSGMLSVPEEYLVFGNGASELFMAIVHAVRPKKVLIPVPSFYGYEYAVEASGGECVFYPLEQEKQFRLDETFLEALTEKVDMVFLANPNNPTGKVEASGGECVFYPLEQEKQFRLDETFLEALTEKVDMVFLANPNNPTGKRMSRAYLRRLLGICKEKRILTVLDECFIEFCGKEYSMIQEISAYDNLILVRAFTKSFSIPGVRLGYLVCSNQSLSESISRQLPEWNLSCFAQEAGIVCAGQQDFLEKTVAYVREERQFLKENLEEAGLEVFESDANFLLFCGRKDLDKALLEQGILIRNCENFRGLSAGYYRIAVKNRKDNEMLSAVMKSLTGKGMGIHMENSHRFFENRQCRYFPCHKGLEELNCLFCYCPLYGREDCPGNPVFMEKNGRRIKVCTGCTFPHRPENYDRVLEILKKAGK